MIWEVLYYTTESGRSVVEEFIDALPLPTRAKTARQIGLLEKMGTDLGMPHSKSLGNGLTELRVRSGRGTNEVRIFYVFEKDHQIFMLHGFIKKTQQTPHKELDIALQRKREIEDLI